MMFDVERFGSFSITLLEAIRDECPKASVFTLFALPDHTFSIVDDLVRILCDC